MDRITERIDQRLLEDAMAELGTTSKVATINGALREVANRRNAREIIAAFDSAEMDFSGPGEYHRGCGGRDLSRLEADARIGLEEDSAS